MSAPPATTIAVGLGANGWSAAQFGCLGPLSVTGQAGLVWRWASPSCACGPAVENKAAASPSSPANPTGS
jgi:hypothetical protein